MQGESNKKNSRSRSVSSGVRQLTKANWRGLGLRDIIGLEMEHVTLQSPDPTIHPRLAYCSENIIRGGASLNRPSYRA